ncbi:adenylosuccinate lyase [Candidatus Gracilibacteria bacterium]|nr:adenylosuccinate lyase [Candidatus Gracilibacteria bacterium]
MELNSLTAISPIDGRYQKQTQVLDAYFSEYALIRRRFLVEVEYFIQLIDWLPQLEALRGTALIETMRNYAKSFSLENAKRIKEIEKVTNHDVKAVEYFLKEKLSEAGWGEYAEFVHFGLTSQDVDSTSRTSLFQEALNEVYLPLLNEVFKSMDSYADIWKNIPMLAHTHGQPASPTTVGKELAVFVNRLQKEFNKAIPLSAKFGGATGNMNAQYLAYPEIDWRVFAETFLMGFDLRRDWPTTQIEHYDSLAENLHNLVRINTILIDFAKDMWTYISMGYFVQKPKDGEVGSSTMPHKVNPIDFENAEGNLGWANAGLEYLAKTLPVSRLQRDLSGSTLIRNLGVPMAHMIIALNSIKKGLGKIVLNQAKLSKDLNNNHAVVAEAIQTILRREGYPNPYEELKKLTRTGEQVSRQDIVVFIGSLQVSDEIKAELLDISPSNYIGMID